MKLKVTGKDENGNIILEGLVNKREATFLLNYACNDLLSAGVQFYLSEPYDPALDDEDAADQPLRIKTPDWGNLN
jgi:hypothetical protein